MFAVLELIFSSQRGLYFNILKGEISKLSKSILFGINSSIISKAYSVFDLIIKPLTISKLYFCSFLLLMFINYILSSYKLIIIYLKDIYILNFKYFIKL